MAPCLFEQLAVIMSTATCSCVCIVCMQVGELLLARAELAAVCGKAAAAELYLATYTACLDSAGRRNSPEYAQARMRQGVRACARRAFIASHLVPKNTKYIIVHYIVHYIYKSYI